MRVSREKAAENRVRIVETASRLFREGGFEGVGVDAVMNAAGLTHGGFYGHFGSKDELAAEAVARAIAALGADMARQRDAVRHGLTAHVRGQLDHFSRLLRNGPAAKRCKRAITTLAGMVGALTLARGVDDPVLSNEILAVARHAFGRAPSADQRDR